MILLVLLALWLLVTPAAADVDAGASADAPAAPAATVIATQPLALLGQGLSLSYERLLLPRTSAAVLAGGRAASGGDFSSRTGTLGVAVRWWPLSSAARPMRRLSVGLSASAGLTSVTDDVMDYRIGSAWTLTQRLDLGYRFLVGGHVTLMPTLGLGLREDVDRTGRLATTARPTLGLGFELGWRLR